MEAIIYDFINQKEVGTVKLTDTDLYFKSESEEIYSGLITKVLVLSGSYVKRVDINLKDIKEEEDLKRKAQNYLPDGFSFWKNW